MGMDHFKSIPIFSFAFFKAECYYIMTTCILIKRTKVKGVYRTLFTQKCSVLVLKEVVHSNHCVVKGCTTNLIKFLFITLLLFRWHLSDV